MSVNKPVDGEWKEEGAISGPQVKFIDSKCKQLGIDVIKFINMGTEQYNSIEDIKKKTASKMLSTLNEYQTKNKDIPSNIKGYDSNWR